MKIRTYLPGDEALQVALYNQVAIELPRFKPATLDEVRRRYLSESFDARTRFYAEEEGRVVGYSGFHPKTGRVSYPWCLKAHAGAAEPLFVAVLDAMRQRGLKTAMAAYRHDWPVQTGFFLAHGFQQVREMVNFVLDMVEMPTPAARRSYPATPLRVEDIPTILEMGKHILRLHTVDELKQYFFQNPYFPPEAVFVLRSRTDQQVMAVGILIENPKYADPKTLDSNMPCYRLGGFGTEGMEVKRVKGMFSFLTRDGREFGSAAMDLMGYAAQRLEQGDASALAVQVPSDAPNLLRFYQQLFRKQGSFPVFERQL